MSKTNTLELINSTAPGKIAELEMVKEKFIKNYNLSNGSTQGDLMYHRQLVYFNQNISNVAALQNCDKFSLYACFVTAAVNGYSFDPEDNEVYLVPFKGKAVLMRQAGAHIRRLQKTKQVSYVDQPRLVYRGDLFEMENGRVIKHIEKLESDEIIAGYVRFILDGRGTEKFFIYRKSDWESWKKKSLNPNGDTWNDNGQVNAGFLRTKIIKHACKEKCWATGSTPAGAETFLGVEAEEDEFIPEVEPTPFIPPAPEYSSFEDVPTGASIVDEEAF